MVPELGALTQIYRRLGREDIYLRPQMTERERCIARISALLPCTQQGALLCEAFEDALGLALTVPEVEDLIIHLGSYIGLAKAFEAMIALDAVLQSGGKNCPLRESRSQCADLPGSRRTARGVELYSLLDAPRVPRQMAFYGRLSTDYYPYVMGLFGCTFERASLGVRDREIATVAALAAAGNCHPQLAFHARVALEQGIPGALLAEILIHVQLVAGLPVANNAATTVIEVMEAAGTLLGPVSNAAP